MVYVTSFSSFSLLAFNMLKTIPQIQSKAKATPLAQDAFIQEVVSEEETKFDIEMGNSNWVYTDNP